MYTRCSQNFPTKHIQYVLDVEIREKMFSYFYLQNILKFSRKILSLGERSCVYKI